MLNLTTSPFSGTNWAHQSYASDVAIWALRGYNLKTANLNYIFRFSVISETPGCVQKLTAGCKQVVVTDFCVQRFAIAFSSAVFCSWFRSPSRLCPLATSHWASGPITPSTPLAVNSCKNCTTDVLGWQCPNFSIMSQWKQVACKTYDRVPGYKLLCLKIRHHIQLRRILLVI